MKIIYTIARSAEKVADLRDEVSDMMEDAEEIGGILAQPLGGEEFDDVCTAV